MTLDAADGGAIARAGGTDGNGTGGSSTDGNSTGCNKGGAGRGRAARGRGRGKAGGTLRRFQRRSSIGAK